MLRHSHITWTGRPVRFTYMGVSLVVKWTSPWKCLKTQKKQKKQAKWHHDVKKKYANTDERKWHRHLDKRLIANAMETEHYLSISLANCRRCDRSRKEATETEDVEKLDKDGGVLSWQLNWGSIILGLHITVVWRQYFHLFSFLYTYVYIFLCSSCFYWSANTRAPWQISTWIGTNALLFFTHLWERCSMRSPTAERPFSCRRLTCFAVWMMAMQGGMQYSGSHQLCRACREA